jgi:hypothetical protein
MENEHTLDRITTIFQDLHERYMNGPAKEFTPNLVHPANLINPV